MPLRVPIPPTIFPSSDSFKDDQIESIIAQLSAATEAYHQADGTMYAPSAAHILVVEKA
ncbi:MAG: hypothetical protein ABJT22_16620 [Parasphingorhabdus sp.]|uniref:hypothetical protein n=1 Tax=Parasphingorhabdus sp. TaxID=2709688 RepID=UPI0032977E81